MTLQQAVELSRDPRGLTNTRMDPSSLDGLLTEAAHRAPSHGVRCFPAGTGTEPDGRLLSYPDLLTRSRRVLAALRQRGVEPGRAVVLLMESPEDFVGALWACLLGGNPVCPLTPAAGGAPLTAERLRNVSSLLNGPAVISTERLRGQLPGDIGVITLESLSADVRGLPIAPSVASQPDDIAMFFLTSGSTGVPKAVELSHANLLASIGAKAELLGLSSLDVGLNWIAFDHVAALEGHLLALWAGANQLQVAPDAVVADPLRLLRLVDAHRVSFTFIPNFLLGAINRALGESAEEAADLRLDLSCLRRVLSGGEANPLATGVEFLERLAPYGLGRGALWPAFGMTETCAGSIFNPDFPEADRGARFAAVGRPIRGMRVRVVDAEMAPVDEGRVGEVQLAGPMVVRGYRDDPASTAAAFTRDGWFRTGDLGRLDDGRLTLVGRAKDSIVISGVSYHSHEIEAVLREIPGVERDHIAAVPLRPVGSETEQLAVLFASSLPTADPTTDPVALRRLLTTIRSTVIQHWGFRPALVLPLPVSAFRKSSLGKVQRSMLRERLQAGDFSGEAAEIERLIALPADDHEPPLGPTETALAEIYARLFQADPASISATTGFFELGGTSLDILRFSRLTERRFPTARLSLTTLLTAPTIRQLARIIDAGRSGSPACYEPLVPLQTTGEKTPLFCVHPGVGEVVVFVNLARYFAHERPFYALRAPGFDPGQRPFGTFAEMASSYAEAITARQPHGPYALAGYSFGAAVAFEIAKILEARGEQVAFLGNFNLPPHIRERMNELDSAENAAHLAMFLELITKPQVAPLADRLRALPAADRTRALLDAADPARALELNLDEERFATWVEVASNLTRLGRGYEPAGMVRSMTVFCAEPLRGSRREWVEQELRAWDGYTTEPNRYVEIPGEHYTLMGPEHVAAFQAVLRAELDRALAGR